MSIFPTDDELFVAQILLDLPDIIRVNKFKWGFRRRRSNLYEGAPETAAGSPVTPLTFAPSEPDDKKARHAFKKKSIKREMDEYNDSIKNLIKRRDFYRGEIENVTEYYKKLNAYNSELKAMKQEVLNSCPSKNEPEIEKSIGTGIGFTQTNYHISMGMSQHQQPLDLYPTAQKLQHSLGPITAQFYASYNGFGSFNGVGPLEIPDLNISAGVTSGFDPSRPLDESRALIQRRARFAEARRFRKGIMKIKSMRRDCGIKS
ncbi:hypothetical protein CASFOL_015946 [Castilleja foliolosa]|uniref:Uncharacterized protein n=1 Tax=Castilleja foliolosa TaxID=1961234 RepID=A0ABD3DF68_9LAMI